MSRRRRRGTLAGAVLAALALAGPVGGTSAAFSDPAEVSGGLTRSFTVAPPALSCTPRSPTTSNVSATISWTAQSQPGTAGGLLTQTASAPFGGALTPTAVGASNSLTLTSLTYASNPTLPVGSTRDVTVTVTSTLQGTTPAWSTSSTQVLRVTRPGNNDRRITCL